MPPFDPGPHCYPTFPAGNFLQLEELSEGKDLIRPPELARGQAGQHCHSLRWRLLRLQTLLGFVLYLLCFSLKVSLLRVWLWGKEEIERAWSLLETCQGTGNKVVRTAC